MQCSATLDSIESVCPLVKSESATDIRDLTLEELEAVVIAVGERRFRGAQLAGWLYDRGARSFDQMTNVPAALRHNLDERFMIGPLPPTIVSRSTDGTRKLLLTLSDGEQIETVIIPTSGRVTLCLSSQAGCAMGCEFCATARMGLHRNLGVAEILSQVFAARAALAEGEELTNYVFMGMGEPLANYPRLLKVLRIMTAEWGMGISPRRITVSTVGLVPMMERLLNDIPVNLAVSLHAGDQRAARPARADQSALSARSADRSLPESAASTPPPHHVRVRDAGRGQRFTRAGEAGRAAARAAARQGQSDFFQPVSRVSVAGPARATRSSAFKRSCGRVT